VSEYDSGSVIGHFPCIANEVAGKKNCNSSDALAVYEHDGADGNVWYDAYCYSCCQSFNKDNTHSASVGISLGVKDGVIVERKPFVRASKKAPLTKQEVVELIKTHTYETNNYRGVKDEYRRFFGQLHVVSEDGVVLEQLYPETRDMQPYPTGYKRRVCPKDFSKGGYGLTGLGSDFAGQIKFKDYFNQRDILLVGGENDLAAAYRMLDEHHKARGTDQTYLPTAVISPTTGEGSAYKQAQAQYDFLNRFQNIYIGYDADDSGREAAEKTASVLPRDKVKIVSWSMKDPNAMLLEGRSKAFINDFYSARPIESSGIVLSGELDDAVFEELLLEKIPLPPFMAQLQKLMAGGIPLGVIVNLGAASGGGKTSFINEMIYYWLFNSPHMVGIVSLELSKGQYGLAMLSRHAGKKLQLIEDPHIAVDLLKTPEYVELRRTLWKDEYGKDRFVLLDERDGSVSKLQNQCERLVNKYGAKLIVLDPVQDILDGSTNEEQSVFMRWQKAMVKKGITFININHVRKSGQGDKANSAGKDLVEEDFQGSSSIFKSGAANILFMRDKYEEDPIMKNVTKAVASKIRWTGHTGYCGSWFYDIDTHTIHDFKTYFTEHKNLLPVHIDIDNPHRKPEKGGSAGKKSFVINTGVAPIDVGGFTL
jgi:KaiC/GvpD/RAD55 family RecA-like ATPase